MGTIGFTTNPSSDAARSITACFDPIRQLKADDIPRTQAQSPKVPLRGSRLHAASANTSPYGDRPGCKHDPARNALDRGHRLQSCGFAKPRPRDTSEPGLVPEPEHFQAALTSFITPPDWSAVLRSSLQLRRRLFEAFDGSFHAIVFDGGAGCHAAIDHMRDAVRHFVYPEIAFLRLRNDQV